MLMRKFSSHRNALAARRVRWLSIFLLSGLLTGCGTAALPQLSQSVSPHPGARPGSRVGIVFLVDTDTQSSAQNRAPKSTVYNCVADAIVRANADLNVVDLLDRSDIAPVCTHPDRQGCWTERLADRQFRAGIEKLRADQRLDYLIELEDDSAKHLARPYEGTGPGFYEFGTYSVAVIKLAGTIIELSSLDVLGSVKIWARGTSVSGVVFIVIIPIPHYVPSRDATYVCDKLGSGLADALLGKPVRK